MQPRNRQEIGLYLTGDVSPLMTTYELIKLLLVEVNVHYPSPHDCLIYKKDAQITGEYPDPDCILSWPILSEIIVVGTSNKEERDKKLTTEQYKEVMWCYYNAVAKP